MEDCLNYLEEVRNRSKNKTIYIYGAGRKAIGLLKMLHEADIYPSGFLVTNAEENKTEEEGLPIRNMHKPGIPVNDILVLIGVRERWVEDVKKTLDVEGYVDYLEPPKGIEYLSDKDQDRSRHTVLQITTQIGCRIDCRYCPQQLFVSRYTADEKRQTTMKLSDYKRYIDQTDSDVIIDFAGFSEPFFNPDCPEMIRYAISTGHAVELYTTLVGLTMEGFDRIRDIPFREVVLHIPDEEMNSKISVTESYLNLLNTVMNAKKGDGSPFIDWASCHGEMAASVRPVIEGRLRVITQLHDRAGNVAGERLEERGRMMGPIRCSNTDAQYHNHNVLLPDGTVLLCDSDWGMQHILGNLNDNTYNEIRIGREAQSVKQLRASEDGDVICRRCCYAIPDPSQNKVD